MDVVVLAGGLSPERDVSLSSGSLIANALMKNGHRVLLMDLYTGLEDADEFEGAWEKHRSEEYQYTVPEVEPDLEALKREHGGREVLVGPGILSICRGADVTFLALHGSIGENGQLQAVLDTHCIRYTGTGYTGSLLAMDKMIAKELMRFHGVQTPDWIMRSAKEPSPPFLPCVVKPNNCGSSIGVSIVKTQEEYQVALEYAVKYEDTLLVEKMIPGREIQVGVLDGKALPSIEILPAGGFYDYRNKYQKGVALEVCPANVSPELEQRLGEAAQKVHKILRLGSYSRIDFMVDAQENIHCLEANTLPGMTPTSLLPQEAAAAGIPYEELCERIVQSALSAK